ncbi:LAME_0G14664g1_1 [Lachancea meyersii CBS 8951]|uniref:LAME_0G14664g1_1 n=1 Tax=Lachancea meyersii CBS 8951 TaxID=1266667 RepID=A0A1G4KAG9_9SACH|nr:LAME_0G14664g1_1 [Lachancea meyersii CBS 8951]
MVAQHVDAITVSIKLPHQKEEVRLKLVKSSTTQILNDALQFSSPKCLTNLDFYFNGKKLTGEEALKDFATDDSLKLDVKYKAYNTRDVLRHIVVVRDTIGFATETQDGITDFAVSTGNQFCDMPLQKVKVSAAKETDSTKEEKPESAAFDLSKEEAQEFQQTVKEILNQRKSVKEIMTTRSSIVSPCVRSLQLSSYNPVPAFYRSKGHLLYLQIVTLEGETFNVTATTTGFYVNKFTANKFDPSPKDQNAKTFVSLIDLLSSHSKNFNEHFKRLGQRVSAVDSVCHARPSTTFLCKPWMVSTTPNSTGDYSRFQLNESDLNTERNFNDEFQAIKDMTSNDFQSIIDSEKLTAKVYHEFTETAVKDAMSIFYDDLVPMNPEAPTQEQIFLKNNIFYSYVGDVNGSYSSIGGDAAAFAASNQDLQTVKLLQRVTLSEIHYLLCAVIDFAGRRVLAQTPVPGLLSAMGSVTKVDPESGETVTEDLNSDVNVVYGLEESTGDILYDKEFDTALESFAQILHLKKHQVGNAEIKVSSHSKGIVGSDKRKYILDLANSHPLDVNFARKFYDGIEESKRYPHRQTLVRNELVDKWWANKIEAAGIPFEKAFEEKMFAFNPDAFIVEGAEDPLVEEISNYLTDEVMTEVVKEYAAGNTAAPYDGDHLTDSLHRNGINMRYLGHVIGLAENELKQQEEKHESKLAAVKVDNEDHENWEKDYLLKVERLIKERQAKINKLVEEGKDIPEDLKGNLKLDENEIRKPTKGEPVSVNRDHLSCLINVCRLEIAARSLKHVLRAHAKDLPVSVIPSLVAYFFNLLFASSYNETPVPEILDEFYSQTDFSFSKVSRTELLEAIRVQGQKRFLFDLSSEILEDLCKQPFTLIRAVSKKFGIQLANKNHFFTVEEFENFKQSQDKKVRGKLAAPTHTFSPSDLAVIPVIKDGEYQSLSGDNFWTQGTSLLSEKPEDGLVLLNQALTIKEEVNGIVHPSVAESYLTISTIYHSLNKVPEAVSFCRKACTIYERTKGADSFELIRCLTNLAILEISNKCPYNGACVLSRVVNTLSALCLTVHPAIINAYTMLQQASLASKNAYLAIEVMKKLSATILDIENGQHSLAYGYNQSRIGDLYVTLKDYTSSLKAISEAEQVFTRELGLNDETTAQCKQWVTGLQNLLQHQQQQQHLTQTQTAVNSGTPAASSKKPKASKKEEKSNPELANKSVDELLNYIEGGSTKKPKAGKKKGKK